MTTFLDFPFHLDGRGRSATTPESEHIRDLIIQVLFTSPGERVNRPEFGCGLKSLVFAPNSVALAAATEFLVKGALQTWLADRIAVARVEVDADDARLNVTVEYTVLETGERRVEELAAPA